MKPEERIQALETIAAQIAVCTACQLHEGRTRTVPGDGSVSADIMFIGEGPGFHEDQQGLPFVGASGQYLEKLLGMIGLKRHDVFITNVVKCRPPGNRDPLPNEIDTCTSAYLKRQIELIDPILIATLGRFSMGMFFPNEKISRIHGQQKVANGRIYFPLFHPAAILRNENMKPMMEEDFKKILKLVKDARDGKIPGIGAPAETFLEIPKKDEPPQPPKQLSLF